MTYRISPEVLERANDLVVYLIVTKGLTNRLSEVSDLEQLQMAERRFQEQFGESDVRTLPSVEAYRELFDKFGINPNRFPPSIEAMLKRISKGSHLPLINKIVDRCNAISIETQVSLGAHDMAGMGEDLALRLSTIKDRFLPLGSTEWEEMPDGELVFATGQEIQTRRGMWRQSEQGKSDLTTKDVYFHLVGFSRMEELLKEAVHLIEHLIEELSGSYEIYRIDASNPEISA